MSELIRPPQRFGKCRVFGAYLKRCSVFIVPGMGASLTRMAFCTD